MNKKGFTLIELLAVIVILAIIALIATPIVLGIIEDSKNSSNKVTAQYIVDAVEQAHSIAYALNNGATPTVEQVSAQFKMSGAEWKADNTIATTDGTSVVCAVNEDENGTSFSISCTGNGIDGSIDSETMSVATTVSAE